jgi:hypothetical protein
MLKTIPNDRNSTHKTCSITSDSRDLFSALGLCHIGSTAVRNLVKYRTILNTKLKMNDSLLIQQPSVSYIGYIVSNVNNYEQ